MPDMRAHDRQLCLAVRKAFGWSQYKLAEYLRTSRSSISHVETGLNMLPSDGVFDASFRRRILQHVADNYCASEERKMPTIEEVEAAIRDAASSYIEGAAPTSVEPVEPQQVVPAPTTEDKKAAQELRNKNLIEAFSRFQRKRQLGVERAADSLRLAHFKVLVEFSATGKASVVSVKLPARREIKSFIPRQQETFDLFNKMLADVEAGLPREKRERTRVVGQQELPLGDPAPQPARAEEVPVDAPPAEPTQPSVKDYAPPAPAQDAPSPTPMAPPEYDVPATGGKPPMFKLDPPFGGAPENWVAHESGGTPQRRRIPENATTNDLLRILIAIAGECRDALWGRKSRRRRST